VIFVREFTIGKLSALADVNAETIRYFEKIGMMPRAPRNDSGYRVYTSEHLLRLLFIRRARELGFSQSEVRRLLTLVDEHSYTCAQVREMTARQLASVSKKIDDLRKLEAVLADMVARCDGGEVPECPIVDILSVTPDDEMTTVVD